MRFLKLEASSDFSLTADILNPTTPYAILSHTWGHHDEEVNFRDLIVGSGKTKAGYRKLRFCRAQAARDGLQHFWVDTCCINKSSDSELSEAINSMFRWYGNAAKCYVYLTDVSTNGHNEVGQSLQQWEAAFRSSRWFTRGWTLQELIAPPSVEFFCSNGKRLGDKKSLERQIHEITGIPVSALQGTPLSGFSFDDRMSWATHRMTTREEDEAYSMLGIFDISMSAIYGEGREKAFRRLKREWNYQLHELSTVSQDTSNPAKQLNNPRGQTSLATFNRDTEFFASETLFNDSIRDHSLLNRLPFTADAQFNSLSKQHAPICLPETRVDLLREIQNWADGQDKRCIFWLNGLAGTGKSTIARTIARRYFEEKRLGASFFFAKGGGDVGHSGKFVTSIAVQLATSIPHLHHHICDAIRDNGDITSQSLRDQWHQLILRPLSKLDGGCYHSSYVLVVDALDECDGDNNIRNILQLLAEARSLRKVRLRSFLTSRPEIPIRHGIAQIPLAERRDFVLHSISPSIIDRDISIFLEHTLRLIGLEDEQDADWPGSETIRRLVDTASGLFIWAATACRFIREGLSTEERLRLLLEGSNAPATPEEHLNEIYTTVLRNSIQPSYIEQERQIFYGMLSKLLGSIVALFSPLSVESLSRLLHNTKQQVKGTLKSLHAILDIPKDDNFPLRLHHPSFRDFLLNNSRCRDRNFWVDEKQAHQLLVYNCIQLMSTSLKQDICGLKTPGILIPDIERNLIQHSLPFEVQYACLYWARHLQNSGSQLHDNDEVHRFLEDHFLHWLEALGWMGKISEGIYAIAALESIVLVDDCPDLFAFLYDMKRFALYGRQVIEQAPLQVYYSVLAFAPTMSIVRKRFKDRVTQLIRTLPEVEIHWNALLQTLEGHSGGVKSVAFSPDSKLLASASDDKTIRIWDAATGTLQQTLEGHSGLVGSVAFSADSKLLASASNDETVKIWDAATGTLQQTLKGHSNKVNSVAFSPDSKLLASASSDETVQIWDVVTVTLQQTLNGHSGIVWSVAFSADSKLLASASSDKTVRIWDATTGTLKQTLNGHSGIVWSVAFSADSKLLASASSDETVQIWDAVTGTLQQTLEGHSDAVNSVAFSADSKLLASASDDDTVEIWDVVTGTLQQTLKGHNAVWSVAISADSKLLASASSDETVRIWDATTGTLKQTLREHSNTAWSVALSPDSKLLASASYDKTIGIWKTATGTLQQTLEGHSDEVNSVAFSPDSKLLASGSDDKTVGIWDAATGTLQQTLNGHSGIVWSVAFSADSKLLASASSDKTVRIWDATTGTLQQTLKGHSSSVRSVAFSADSKLLASASIDKTVRIWDAITGTLQRSLEGYSGMVYSVAFSADSKLLASGSDDSTIKIWDAVTGTLQRTFKGHSSMVCSVAFSANSKLLASASYDENVNIWDTATGTLQQIIATDNGVSILLFDITNSTLLTNVGHFKLNGTKVPSVSMSSQDIVSKVDRIGLGIGGSWVTWNGQNLLWLPPSFRAVTSDISRTGSTVAIGCQSGKVFIVGFSYAMLESYYPK